MTKMTLDQRRKRLSSDPQFQILPPSGKGFVIVSPQAQQQMIKQAELEGQAESRAFQRHRMRQQGSREG